MKDTTGVNTLTHKKRTGLWIFLTIIFSLVVIIAGVKIFLGDSLQKLAETKISNVDFSQVKDGVYPGSYKSFPVEAAVEVTISNHKITKIDLTKHFNGQGGAAEVLPDKVVESQSLEIDAISGATYSSKVILKSIENALTSAGAR